MEPVGCTRNDDLVGNAAEMKHFLGKLHENVEDLVFDLYSVISVFLVSQGMKKDDIKKLPPKVFDFADTLKSMELAKTVSEYAYQKYKMGSLLDEREISCYARDVFETGGKEYAMQQFKSFMHVFETMKASDPTKFNVELEGKNEKLKSIIRKTKRHVTALKKLVEKKDIIDRVGIDGLYDDMQSWIANLEIFVAFAENPEKEM